MASAESERRSTSDMVAFSSALFRAAGLDQEKADCVAQLLVMTDMMGRATHGLSQCDAYLKEITDGQMTREGDPEVVSDLGATVVWDGGYRPGHWLVTRALEQGFERIEKQGVVTFVIRKSHHIGCLAALAKMATDRGLMVIMASSGPHTKFVAPYGGKEGLFSPNPFAVGFPATQFPVLFDTCATLTTVSMTREKAAQGELFPSAWLLDSDGSPTRDPSVMESAQDRGSLMLLGGLGAGHKGFGMAIIVEALTQGLAGYGRKDGPTRWGASVYIQLLDPEAFAGLDAFTEQMDFFIACCQSNAPIDRTRPVRLPGEQANRLIGESRENGIVLSPETRDKLTAWAVRLGVDAGALGA